MDWKAINAQRLAPLHPIFAARVKQLLDTLEAEGEPCLITEGLRTWAEQHQIWRQGRTLPGAIVTKADAGFSQHNYGLAVDLCPFEPGASGLDWDLSHPVWKRLLALAPQFKLAEGAQWRTFPDNPHFYPEEIPATTAELRAQYANGGIAAVNAWFAGLVAGAAAESESADVARNGDPQL